MNPKIVAGVSGVASLAILALLGSRSQNHSINKRAIIVEENDDLMVIDDEAIDAEPAWNEDNLARFLKDFQSMDDIQMKKDLNFNSLKTWWKELDDIRPQLVVEYDSRMATGKTWADSLVTPDAATFPSAANDDGHGNCESNPTSTSLCWPIDGMDETSNRVQQLIDANGCEAADYHPFNDDKNTNVWFMIPKAIPLWVGGGSHIDEWAKMFTFVKDFAETHWKVDHKAAGRTVRLTIGLYMSGVQLIPKGIKLNQNSPLAKLTRWYSKPSVSARKPKFTSVLKVLDGAIGSGIYKMNSANGILLGSGEDRDNCYALTFFQDIPADLVALHQRKTDTSGKMLAGDMIDSLNKKCNMNYAFVMKDINVAGSDANEFYTQMKMVLHPGLSDYFPFDPDYSGFYALNTFDEVVSSNFANHVKNAMCLQSARQQCKLRVAGIKQSPTVATNMDDYETATGDYDYPTYDNAEGSAYKDWVEDEYGDADDFKELAAGDIVPDPQCCGGNIYTAKHFNNAIKSCQYANADGSVVVIMG